MTLKRKLAPLVLLPAMLLSPAVHAFTIKIATLAPDGTSWMKEMRAGADEIERRTSGRVSIKFYPGGVMGNDTHVLRKIRIGQLHGGAFTAASLSDIYPGAQTYSLPLVFRTQEEVRYVRERMDGLLREGLEEKGLVALGISGGGFAYLMSQQPLTVIGDFKGRRVWVPQGDIIGQDIFNQAGGSPVSLPISDVYTGLQTGLVDTVASTPTGTIAFQWHSRLARLIDVPITYVVGIFAIDQKTFYRLQQSDQAVVREVMGTIADRLEKQNLEDNEQARQALARQGMVFDTPAEVEVEKLRAISRDVIEKMANRDVYSYPLLEMMRKYLAEYRASVAPHAPR